MDRRRFITSSLAALAGCVLAVRTAKGATPQKGILSPYNTAMNRLAPLATACGVTRQETYEMLRAGVTQAGASLDEAGRVLEVIFIQAIGQAERMGHSFTGRLILYDYGFHYQRAQHSRGTQCNIVTAMCGPRQWNCPITHALMPIFATLS